MTVPPFPVSTILPLRGNPCEHLDVQPAVFLHFYKYMQPVHLPLPLDENANGPHDFSSFSYVTPKPTVTLRPKQKKAHICIYYV